MSRKILVIDDDQSMCELLHDSLQQRGWEAVWRLRAEHGLELAGRQSFDAVITDINLEQMSGIELCRQLTEIQPDTPVIMVTGSAMVSSAIAALRAGASDFITKPIEMRQLEHVLSRAVQHRELREQVRRSSAGAGGGPGLGELAGESRAMLEDRKSVV